MIDRYGIQWRDDQVRLGTIWGARLLAVAVALLLAGAWCAR